MVMTTKSPHAGICGEIPKLDGQVRRAGGQVRSRRGEGNGVHRVGMSLESANVVTRFMIPNLPITPEDTIPRWKNRLKRAIQLIVSNHGMI